LHAEHLLGVSPGDASAGFGLRDLCLAIRMAKSEGVRLKSTVADLGTPARRENAQADARVQQPVRPIVLYIFLWHFALASDINDMVR